MCPWMHAVKYFEQLAMDKGRIMYKQLSYVISISKYFKYAI